MSGSWLAIAALAAVALLLALALIVRSVRARRNWVVPPEGTLEARLQAFAPLTSTAEKPAEAGPKPEPEPELAPESALDPAPVPAPRPHNSVEIEAGGVVIGVVEGSESHRRFRAAADELLGDLKDARDASR